MYVHYIPVNTSCLELCQLTLRTKLGDSLEIKKSFGRDYMSFSTRSIARCLIEKMHSFVVIFIAMLLLLVQDK